jgi:hypothetical protein
MTDVVAGNILGSVYEFENIGIREFPIFSGRFFLTDDAVLAVGPADSMIAYLKTHYPAQFMATNMNSEIDDIDRIAVLVKDCQRLNIPVRNYFRPKRWENRDKNLKVMVKGGEVVFGKK